MKFVQIPTKGTYKAVIVDDEDYEFTISFNWSVCNGYIMRATYKNGKPISIYLHKEIVKAPKDSKVRFKNGIKTDLRRSNLEIITHKARFDHYSRHQKQKSKYKGVYWHPKANKFVTYYEDNFIGYFEKEYEAALAYNASYTKYTGDINLPNKVPGVSLKNHNRMPKSTRYRGVKCRSYNCWGSYITVDKVTRHLGHFSTEREAAEAYNKECDRLNLQGRKNII